MMKFFFSKNENGQEIEEEILMVNETLDVRSVHIQQQEIVSVIGLALAMYTNQLEKDEKTAHGFQEMVKSFSPWSSKIHGMRQQPLYMPNLKRK
jgi:thioredoxin-related protein